MEPAERTRQALYLQRAAELAALHPDHEIHFLACSEQMLADYNWTGHLIESVELAWWWENGEERICTDLADIVEELGELHGREFSIEEAATCAKPAILIKTAAG